MAKRINVLGFTLDKVSDLIRIYGDIRLTLEEKNDMARKQFKMTSETIKVYRDKYKRLIEQEQNNQLLKAKDEPLILEFFRVNNKIKPKEVNDDKVCGLAKIL